MQSPSYIGTLQLLLSMDVLLLLLYYMLLLLNFMLCIIITINILSILYSQYHNNKFILCSRYYKTQKHTIEDKIITQSSVSKQSSRGCKPHVAMKVTQCWGDEWT